MNIYAIPRFGRAVCCIPRVRTAVVQFPVTIISGKLREKHAIDALPCRNLVALTSSCLALEIDKGVRIPWTLVALI